MTNLLAWMLIFAHIPDRNVVNNLLLDSHFNDIRNAIRTFRSEQSAKTKQDVMYFNFALWFPSHRLPALDESNSQNNKHDLLAFDGSSLGFGFLHTLVMNI